MRLVAGVRRRLQYPGGPAIDYVFARELEIKSPGYLRDKRGILFLLLAQSLRTLLRTQALDLLDFLVLLLFLASRRRTPVSLHELVELNAIDQKRS